MKKFVFLFSGFVAFLPMILNAQLKVLSNGNIEVYTSGSVPHVSSESKLLLETDRYTGLTVQRSGSAPFGSWVHGTGVDLLLYIYIGGRSLFERIGRS